MGRKSKMFNSWDYVVWILLIISGYALLKANMMRTELGYFESGLWITISSITYVVFFALVTGYVIAKILKRVRK